MNTLLKSKRQRADMPKLDQRNFQRVKINVLGRYMLSNHQEFPCHVRNMSPGNLALTGPVIGNLGEFVVVYIDHIGRVDGEIKRHIDGGFAMSINATGRKRDKLSAQLTWLANRHELNLPEDRRHSREAPENPFTTVTLYNGTEIQCRILDMSLSGAAISFKHRADIGMPLMVGKIRSRVVRVFEEGIAVEFARVQGK
ncbi:MAG: PilZ domain-containing protein [Rhizobiales bacterium]|nr:PilZ domain-containing protein [Hyphomicrobiales bacterium]